MFSRLYPAKVRGLALTIKKQDDEDVARACAILQYDFTAELAQAIGGAAPQVQEMLAAGGDGVKLARAGLVLDTKEVSITLKSGDGDKLVIDRTSSLKAKVKQANQEDTGPTLEAAAYFPIDGDEPLSFLRANLGLLVKVRMDKRQLELPAAAPEEEADA